jgi:hypothetical protein
VVLREEISRASMFEEIVGYAPPSSGPRITGRLHRVDPGKTDVRIFDYVDRNVPMLLRMFQPRLRGYRALGYAHVEWPRRRVKASDRLIVEYDVDASNETDFG